MRFGEYVDGTGKRSLVYITLCHELLISKHSDMARVNEGSHTCTVLPATTHTFIHKWNEPYLRSAAAQRHRTLADNSFSVPSRLGRYALPA